MCVCVCVCDLRQNWCRKIQTALKREHEIFPTPHFLPFWIQFGARDIPKNYVDNYEFCENRRNEAHTLGV